MWIKKEKFGGMELGFYDSDLYFGNKIWTFESSNPNLVNSVTVNLVEGHHGNDRCTLTIDFTTEEHAMQAAKLLAPAWGEVTLEEAEKLVEHYRKRGEEITLEEAQEVLRDSKLELDPAFTENGKTIYMKVEGTHLILVSPHDSNFGYLVEPQIRKLSQLNPQLKELTNILLLPCTATLDRLKHLPVKEAISMAININKKSDLPWRLFEYHGN